MCKASLEAKQIDETKTGQKVRSSRSNEYSQPMLSPKGLPGRVDTDIAVCWKCGDVMSLVLPKFAQSALSVSSPVLAMFFERDSEETLFASDLIAFVRTDIDIPNDLSQLTRNHFGTAFPFVEFVDLVHDRDSHIDGVVVSCAYERREQKYPIMQEVRWTEDPDSMTMEELVYRLNSMPAMPAPLENRSAVQTQLA